MSILIENFDPLEIKYNDDNNNVILIIINTKMIYKKNISPLLDIYLMATFKKELVSTIPYTLAVTMDNIDPNNIENVKENIGVLKNIYDNAQKIADDTPIIATKESANIMAIKLLQKIGY